jgi:hypothetical protein
LSSPQGADYSINKEREDVLALQQQTGATLLVGHSFGDSWRWKWPATIPR